MKVLAAIALLILIGCNKTETSDSRLGPAPYDQPPRNTVSDVIASYQTALNDRDSLRFWRLHTWEVYEFDSTRRMIRTIWDSTHGSKTTLTLISSREFPFHVHAEDQRALFSNALIRVVVVGEHNAGPDTVMSVLRVDSGLWRMGTLDLKGQKPFPTEPMNY
jgi:hypothetical protein